MASETVRRKKGEAQKEKERLVAEKKSENDDTKDEVVKP